MHVAMMYVKWMVIDFTLLFILLERNLLENNGVCVKFDDNSPDETYFYGKLEDIIKLKYQALPIKMLMKMKTPMKNLYYLTMMMSMIIM